MQTDMELHTNYSGRAVKMERYFKQERYGPTTERTGWLTRPFAIQTPLKTNDMIKTEIKHITGNVTGMNALRVIETIKTVKIFGIVIYRKHYHYPDLETYETAFV